MIALDTNILVHAHRRDASLHEVAKDCVKELAENPIPWAICYHSLIEFYGIITQPRIWSSPSSPEQAKKQIFAWKESPSLKILTDTPDDIGDLLNLASVAKVTGAMIHDARIANCCVVNGIRELWTVDRDFSRFPKLRTRNPLL